MPLGEIAGELLGGVVRVIGRVLFEVLFELVVKGVGHAVITFFRPRSEPSDGACGLVGLVFWTALVALGFVVYRQAASA